MEVPVIVKLPSWPIRHGPFYTASVTLALIAFAITSGNGHCQAPSHDCPPLAITASAPFLLAQDDSDSSDSDIPPADIDKYVAIYRATQRNRNLTVDQAAAQEGLSIQAFRALEAKIERDDSAREHVRDELQAAAAGSSSPAASAPAK